MKFSAASLLFLALGGVHVRAFRDQSQKKSASKRRHLEQDCVVNHHHAKTVEEVQVEVLSHPSNGNGMFDLTLKSPPYATSGQSVTTSGWCIDYDRFIKNGSYSMDVFSAFDPSIHTNAIDKPGMLPNLAWLVNNVNVGDAYPSSVGCAGGTISWWDMQSAMWMLVDDKNGVGTEYEQNRVQCISEGLAQRARDEGQGYEPDCTDPFELIPLVMVADNDATGEITNQVIMSETLLSSIDGMCECSTPAPTGSPTDSPTESPVASPTKATDAPTEDPGERSVSGAPVTTTPKTTPPTSSPTLPTTCPEEMPSTGSPCGFEGLECAYGKETCCDGVEYDQVMYKCVDGVVEGFHMDTCLMMVCEEPTATPTESPVASVTTNAPTASPTSNPTPATDAPTETTTYCTADVKRCEDGSFVSRVGPNCEFAPCPTGAPTQSPTPPTTCPDEMPVAGSPCGFGGLECAYGKETCCDGVEYDQVLYKCIDGVVEEFHIDTCLTMVCEDPTAAPTESPVASITTTDAPPVSTPATDAPPVSTPATDAPPVSTPATDAPPVATPATDAPPVATPATDAPPVATPATDAPPVSTPATDAPPVSTPATDAPPVATPATDAPPVSTPATDAPPVSTPVTDAPTDAPPVSTPATDAPPVATPATDAPPVSTPATDAPPVSDAQPTAPDDRNVPITPAPTPNKGSGSGDPHFKTWTGEKFDYHGECDLVLVDHPSFNGGQGLKVHIRTTRVKIFSYIEKIALQIGSDILEFDNDVDNFLINGNKVGPNQKHHKTLFAGFLVRRDKKAISVRLHMEGKAKIDFIARKNGFPAVIVDGGSTDIFAGSLGLLGDWSTGRRLARNGSTELNDDDATAFALEWQVRDTEPMLFQESRFPQYPTTCVPPKKMVGNRLGSKHMKEKAEKACAHWKEDKEDCIFDVIATRSVLVAAEGHIEHVQ